MVKVYFKAIKRIFLFIIIAIVMYCNGQGGQATKAAPFPAKKDNIAQKYTKKDLNVLLITLDTLRQDRVSVYNDKYVKTPYIDSLAAKAFIFTRAFSHNPVTLPAHTNILTGTTPRFHGISDNTGYHLEDHFLTLAEYLKQAEYKTGAFIGAFPLDSRFGLDQGFDVYDDNYGTHNQLELFYVERRADKVIAPAIEWITQQEISEKKQKWFAWIHLFDPHQPYQPPPPFRQKYINDPYSGEVAYMDSCLKVLFDFLEKNQLMKNTVIILVADHGEALGEKGEETHSYFAYNNTINIPLILYIPGLVDTNLGNGKGIMINENVCHTDIFPTICDLLNLTPPRHLQGQSIIPLLKPQNVDIKKNWNSREIYFESLTGNLNRGWAPLWGFVRDDLKFIDQPIPEVYDIKSDRHENNNIAKSVNIIQFKRDLGKLKNDLNGKQAMARSQKIDPDIQSKLKSLGYLSGSASSKQKKYTEADDLKKMLPLQNRMLTALAKYQNGLFKEPIEELRSVVNESPSFVLVYRHMATIYQEFGHIDKAIEILNEGLKQNPGNVNLMSKLGIMLAETNQPDKAIELLEFCIQKDPYDPENFNFLGVAYYKKRNAAKALDFYQKALELDHNYASVFNNIGSLYLSLYLSSKKSNEQFYINAIESFNKALEIDPLLFAAYNGRGAAFKFKNQGDSAIKDWAKAIEINPNYIDAYFNIAYTYLEMNKKSSALEILQRCEKIFKSKLTQKDREKLSEYFRRARQ